MRTVRAFWVLLPPPLRRRCLALLGLALVMAATTVAGLVSVMPFFQLLSAPDATPLTRWLQAGETTGLTATHVHEVINLDHEEVVSVHVYSPPLGDDSFRTDKEIDIK